MSNIDDFLAEHPYAESTKQTYRPILKQLLMLDVEKLTSSQLLAFIEKDKWGNSRRHVALCTCRKFIKWAHGNNHPALRTKLKRIKSKPRRAMDPQKAITLLQIFEAQEIKGCRDLTIAMLMLDSGLRVSEVARIQIKNIDFEPILLPGLSTPVYTLSTIIKGGNPGNAIFSADTMMEIKTWLCWREQQKPKHDYLFTNIAENKYNGNPLTVDGLKVTIKRWGEVCGFKLSAHDFRSSFATLVTRFGAPSRTGQKAGRWNRIETFEHYTGTLEQAAIGPYLPTTNLLRRS